MNACALTGAVYRDGPTGEKGVASKHVNGALVPERPPASPRARGQKQKQQKQQGGSHLNRRNRLNPLVVCMVAALLAPLFSRLDGEE